MGRSNINPRWRRYLPLAALCACGSALGQAPLGNPSPVQEGLAEEACEECFAPPAWMPEGISQLEMRTSSSHGRAMGPGGPLRGTSWLNRPYDISFDSGAFLMTSRVSPNVRPGNDYFGALGIGLDFDYYWGVQFRIGWSTPQLLNTAQPDAPKSSNLFLSDLSLLYYPWGDSRLRPYYRIGAGLTDFGYTNDNGVGIDPFLYTMPVGVGMKFQAQRWFAWRAELVDNIAFGQNETDTLHNLTLTFGAEWRFGGKPDGYSAWRRGGTVW